MIWTRIGQVIRFLKHEVLKLFPIQLYFCIISFLFLFFFFFFFLVLAFIESLKSLIEQMKSNRMKRRQVETKWLIRTEINKWNNRRKYPERKKFVLYQVNYNHYLSSVIAVSSHRSCHNPLTISFASWRHYYWSCTAGGTFPINPVQSATMFAICLWS